MCAQRTSGDPAECGSNATLRTFLIALLLASSSSVFSLRPAIGSRSAGCKGFAANQRIRTVFQPAEKYSASEKKIKICKRIAPREHGVGRIGAQQPVACLHAVY